MNEPLRFPKDIDRKPVKPVYEFGPFRVDPSKRLLLQDGKHVALPPRLFETLLVLIEHKGQVVEKDTLMRRLWPDTVVEESNLTVNVSALRKTLGETTGEHRYIVTAPGRGYRFVADVTEASEGEAEDSSNEQITTEGAGEKSAEVGMHKARERPIAPVQTGSTAPEGVDRESRRSWLAVGISLLLLGTLGLLGYGWLSGKFKFRGTPPANGLRSIAVLPFKVLEGNDSNEYLGVGMADTLITRLGNVKEINVRPTSAVLRFGRSGQDPAEAGRELGVESVLEGSIRQSGERVRVTVQLVSAADGRQIWAEKFDERASDVFTVEDRVSARMIDILRLRLTDDEKNRFGKQNTGDANAYVAYLRGRVNWNKRTPESIRMSIEDFQQAISLDSNFALAYAGLADAYALLGYRAYNGLPPSEAMPKAKLAAVRALELDDNLAEAHATLGMVRMRYDWDWPGAEREFKRAIDLNPGYATAHQWYSDYLIVTGRTQQAIEEIDLAQRSDPTSLMISYFSYAPFYFSRQYDRAIEASLNTLQKDRGFYGAHLALGLAYEQKGLYREAIQEFNEAAVSLKGGAGESFLGHAYALAGRRSEAFKLVGQLKQLAQQRYVSPFQIALIYSGLHDVQATLEWLEKAYDDRSSTMVYLNVDPNFDWLRSNSRFRDLLRRLGF